MSIRRCSDSEYFAERIEKAIAGDMEMGNFPEIFRVWVHPSHANHLGMKEGEEAIKMFRVPKNIDIVLSDRSLRRHSIYSGIEFADGSAIPIDLQIKSCTEGCFDLGRMVDNFQIAIKNAGYDKLNGARIHFQGIVAFVAIHYAKKSILTVLNEMEIGGETVLKDIPFLVDHPFLVYITSTPPQSVRAMAKDYVLATVDKNGLVVGERTDEEVSRTPPRFLKV